MLELLFFFFAHTLLMASPFHSIHKTKNIYIVLEPDPLHLDQGSGSETNIYIVSEPDSLHARVWFRD